MSKTKKIIIITSSLLLLALTLLNFYQFGFTYLFPYLLYLLPALLATLSIKDSGNRKGYKIGVIVASVLSVGVGLLVSGGTLNLAYLIIYILLTVAIL